MTVLEVFGVFVLVSAAQLAIALALANFLARRPRSRRQAFAPRQSGKWPAGRFGADDADQ